MESVESHDEKAILDGCIDLMQWLMGEFEKYLEFVEFTPEYEEERFATSITYAEIVERLFLWETYHSGGTSTRKKCNELSVDSSKSVVFKDEREVEDN